MADSARLWVIPRDARRLGCGFVGVPEEITCVCAVTHSPVESCTAQEAAPVEKINQEFNLFVCAVGRSRAFRDPDAACVRQFFENRPVPSFVAPAGSYKA
jgi:hypothetical protein